MRADFLIGPSVVFQLAEWRHRSHRRSWGSGMHVVYFSHTLHFQMFAVSPTAFTFLLFSHVFSWLGSARG